MAPRVQRHRAGPGAGVPLVYRRAGRAGGVRLRTATPAEKWSGQDHERKPPPLHPQGPAQWTPSSRAAGNSGKPVHRKGLCSAALESCAPLSTAGACQATAKRYGGGQAGMHWYRGRYPPPPPLQAPSLRTATVPLTASASLSLVFVYPPRNTTGCAVLFKPRLQGYIHV